VTSSLFHNNRLYPISGRGSGNGLGLMGMVWQERIVNFVRNVRGSNSFNVKGYAVVVFGSILFVIFSNSMDRCCGGLL
jgi:hypothetical protein